MARIVKPVEVDPEDGEILGTYPFEVQNPKMHGSRPKWEGMVARGELRRMRETPKPSAGSRNTRRP
jgi:hypothetical protein